MKRLHSLVVLLAMACAADVVTPAASPLGVVSVPQCTLVFGNSVLGAGEVVLPSTATGNCNRAVDIYARPYPGSNATFVQWNGTFVPQQGWNSVRTDQLARILVMTDGQVITPVFTQGQAAPTYSIVAADSSLHADENTMVTWKCSRLPSVVSSTQPQWGLVSSVLNGSKKAAKIGLTGTQTYTLFCSGQTTSVTVVVTP